MKHLQQTIKTYLSHPLAWIIAGVLSCGLTFYYHLSSQQKLACLQQTAIQLKTRQEWALQKSDLEKNLMQQLKVANRDYIEKELESLKFLKPEIKKLQAQVHLDPQNELIKERLCFLEGDQNRLHFREQNFQRLDRFQEVEAIQDHPVEMNGDDLKALIARIENKTIGSFQPGPFPPDLLIKKFELLKKPMSSNEETFIINLELTKHEMVHE